MSIYKSKVNNFQIAYSQMGEDLIVKNYFTSINKPKPTYLDLGAFDPFKLSNTALLYRSGSRGINIEPNLNQFKLFTKFRPNDVNLNIGIGDSDKIIDYFVISSPVLNTFSYNQAKEYEEKWGYKINKITPVQVRTLSWVIQNYSDGKFPDFLSLDIEGQESTVILAMKTLNSLPQVICVETLSFANDSSGTKRNDLITEIEELGFEIYADTHLNTIFVKKNF